MLKASFHQENSPVAAMSEREEPVKMRCITLKSDCPWMKRLIITLKQNAYFSILRCNKPPSLLENLSHRRPDIFCMLDGDDPVYDPLVLVQQIKKVQPHAEVIIFSKKLTQLQFYGYILAGISGAVSKEHDPKEIKKWLHPLQSDKTLFSPGYARYLVDLVRLNPSIIPPERNINAS